MIDFIRRLFLLFTYREGEITFCAIGKKESDLWENTVVIRV